MQWARLVPELTVADFQVSLHFYTEVLGFEVAFAREDTFVNLERHGVQLMLEAAPSSWPTGELIRPYGRGLNLQMEWPDVAGLRNRLVALAYPLYRDLEEVWREVGARVCGSREFLVQDPDGYLLRFAQDLGERTKSH